MLGVLVSQVASAGLTGYAGPGGARLGWPAVANVNPVLQKNGPARPRTAQNSPGRPNDVSLWFIFTIDGLICTNVQIASTLEQNSFFLGSEMSEFLDIANIS